MDNTSDYRDYLVRTLCEMERMQMAIFTYTVNLAMNGEMKDVDDLFEIGDVFAFKRGDFDRLSDQNVQKLLALLTAIEDTFDFLQNINAISEEEIQEKYAELDEATHDEISNLLGGSGDEPF